MNQFAVSNIGFPPYQHEHMFDAVKQLGFDAIEVAPSRIWKNTWSGLCAQDVERYRKQIEIAGLSVVGLHSLFFDQPDLTVFGEGDIRTRTVDFLVHLSAVCRDLGGKTLVFGSPSARQRREMSHNAALDTVARMFEDLERRTQGHGTVFCMEPLGPTETDFCNTISEIEELYRRIDSDFVRFQLDIRALSANREMEADVFERVAPGLAHVHVNAADLGELREDDGVEHEKAGQLLNAIGYRGAISLEQRSVNEQDYITPLAKSMEIMKEFYA